VPSSDVVARVGADACRLAILYLAPWEQNNMNWSEDTLRGVERFLRRVEAASDNLTDDAPNSEQDVLINRLVADVTERLDGMKFNTAISAMMEFLNAFSGAPMPRRAYEVLIQVLNPFAPHLTEEMWEKLGHECTLVFEPWPTFDASKLVQTTATFAITINGKRVGEFVADLNATDADLTQIARDTVAAKLAGAEIIKTIVVPKKLVNFVVKK
jgi:leucyl-tRNA synthetase